MDLELFIRANVILTIDGPSAARSTLALVILHSEINTRKLHRSNRLRPIILVFETEFLIRLASVPAQS